MLAVRQDVPSRWAWFRVRGLTRTSEHDNRVVWMLRSMLAAGVAISVVAPAPWFGSTGLGWAFDVVIVGVVLWNAFGGAYEE
jgi:hypothetical protein